MSLLKSTDRRSAYLIAAEDLRGNKPQWQAYESNGHCVVFAGPGSGKTKVLTTKLARVVSEEVKHPRGVACLTYSSECARELSRRLNKLGVRTSLNLHIGTVHSFCLKNIVKPFAELGGLEICDPVKVASQSDQERILKRALALEVSADERLTTWAPRCAKYRTTYLDRNHPDWRGKDEQTARVIERYEKLLHDQGMLDFDDMVLMGLRLVETSPWIRSILKARFPFIAVDEYQDLGLPLHRLVLALCFSEEPNSRLFAVGDPDQSIYGFTGAHPELLASLGNDKRVECVKLLLNYRSRSEIVSASEHALSEKRGYKSAAGDGGAIEFVSCREGLEQQATTICNKLIPEVLSTGVARNLGEIAVIYPTKDVGNVIASAASAAGLSCIRIDKNAPYPKSPFTRWLEECAAWCAGGWRNGEPVLTQLIETWQGFNEIARSTHEWREQQRTLVGFLFANRDSSSKLAHWLRDFEKNVLRAALCAEGTLQEEVQAFQCIMTASEAGSVLAEWTVTEFGGQMAAIDHLKLITLHSAKGLEFDVVFMMGLDQGTIPWANLSAEDKREPRRLFYVGLTRARRTVYLLYSGWIQTSFGRKSFGKASEFVIDLWKRLQGQ